MATVAVETRACLACPAQAEDTRRPCREQRRCIGIRTTAAKLEQESETPGCERYEWGRGGGARDFYADTAGIFSIMEMFTQTLCWDPETVRVFDR
ncbi:hypothetical protein BaRGS_00027120 [Batillaria attramentaria]|uniref:Uncharacterized protein n=1 Tax=Batillaria attramentaria TaxID=370345 RepID=A0ABD0K3I1_9CAEN